MLTKETHDNICAPHCKKMLKLLTCKMTVLRSVLVQSVKQEFVMYMVSGFCDSGLLDPELTFYCDEM